MNSEIKGDVVFPEQWTVFAPYDGAEAMAAQEQLVEMSEVLTVDGKTVKARTVTPIRCQYDFREFYGEPPYQQARTAYVFLLLDSAQEQEVTFGMGADWFLQTWLNGAPILDTLKNGNRYSPPAINDHLVTVKLRQGANLLVVKLINGINGAVLAVGGPRELRKGDFRSILPPSDRQLDYSALLQRYPADLQSPIHWQAPSGFDPREPGLGLPVLEVAEHFELMHCKPSKAPLDEGGSGVYESLYHGTWNHNIHPFVRFRDRLIGVWDNHALDENGPGARVLAKVGKIINDRGEVDWKREDSLVEAAPAPVPVRRRKLQSDQDALRGAQAKGTFYVIEDRLFFCGSMTALHGVTTDPDYASRTDQVIPSEHFRFGRGPEAPHAAFARWDLGVRFFQEWAIRDDRLQPISPIYKDREQMECIQLTPEISLPLEPLVAPYSNAPLLAEAPQDFQNLALHGKRDSGDRVAQYPPGAGCLAADGNNGVYPGHGSQFRRPDGAWVVIAENKASKAGPFYYGAEKPAVEAVYPPARRTNLFGGIKPAAGELPDGGNYMVYNSPNRQDMVLTISRDGRLFNATRLLMHRRLHDYTPGIMKAEGGPGSGPQYFKALVLGESLWVIYSISKEHIGATRVPLESLAKM